MVFWDAISCVNCLCNDSIPFGQLKDGYFFLRWTLFWVALMCLTFDYIYAVDLTRVGDDPGSRLTQGQIDQAMGWGTWMIVTTTIALLDLVLEFLGCHVSDEEIPPFVLAAVMKFYWGDTTATMLVATLPEELLDTAPSWLQTAILISAFVSGLIALFVMTYALTAGNNNNPIPPHIQAFLTATFVFTILPLVLIFRGPEQVIAFRRARQGAPGFHSLHGMYFVMMGVATLFWVWKLLHGLGDFLERVWQEDADGEDDDEERVVRQGCSTTENDVDGSSAVLDGDGDNDTWHPQVDEELPTNQQQMNMPKE